MTRHRHRADGPARRGTAWQPVVVALVGMAVGAAGMLAYLRWGLS